MKSKEIILKEYTNSKIKGYINEDKITNNFNDNKILIEYINSELNLIDGITIAVDKLFYLRQLIIWSNTQIELIYHTYNIEYESGGFETKLNLKINFDLDFTLPYKLADIYEYYLYKKTGGTSKFIAIKCSRPNKSVSDKYRYQNFIGDYNTNNILNKQFKTKVEIIDYRK